MQKFLTLTGATFCLSFTAIAVHADIPGTYKTSQRVDGGTIDYTLALKKDGSAELTSERRNSLRVNDKNTRDYGYIVDVLSDDRIARHVGTWRKRGRNDRDFVIYFDYLSHGGTQQYEGMTSDGSVNNDNLRLDTWKHSLYGRRTGFSFNRIAKKNSKDLEKGAGIFALGAVIAAALAHHHDDRSSNDQIDQLSNKSGGSGTYEVDGDNQKVRKMDVQLRSDGTANLSVTLDDDDFVISGRWRQEGRKRIHIDVERIRDRERISGGGTITLRNSRDVDNVDLRFYDEDESTSYSLNFSPR